jgi:hypothetical protein
MMDLETLRELQQRGRFFYEMFPGAKASEEWLRHRDQLECEVDTRDIDFRGTCGEVPLRVKRARGHRMPRSRKRAMPRERC